MSKACDSLRQSLKDFEATPEGYGQTLRLDFAEILWRALKERGWTQKEFAKKCGWSEKRVSNLAHANRDCGLDAIGKACHVLGIKVELRMIPVAPERP